MQHIKIDVGRGSRQAKPRPQMYPLWGVEEPRREWNGHALYRHGVKSVLDRYLITPKPTPLLMNGLTVLDVLAGICVGLVLAPIALLAIDAWGVAFDRCADKLGW